MNSLHRDQLRQSFEQYYDRNGQGFVKINELKRANEVLSKKDT